MLDECYLSGELPAAFSVGTHSSLVELADGGGFAVGWVMREQAAAALPAHTVEEVPEKHQTCYTCSTGNDILTFQQTHTHHHGNRKKNHSNNIDTSGNSLKDPRNLIMDLWYLFKYPLELNQGPFKPAQILGTPEGQKNLFRAPRTPPVFDHLQRRSVNQTVLVFLIFCPPPHCYCT